MINTLSAHTAGGFAGELTALLLENETNQAESAKLQRDAARATYIAEANAQVAALHGAADAALWGACAGAALEVTGGVCQIASAVNEYDAGIAKEAGECRKELHYAEWGKFFGAAGQTSDSLGGFVNTIVGTSKADHDKAEAKRHETAAEEAKWEASDAGSSIDKADRASDKLLNTLSSIQGDENSANNAIIGRI